MKKLDKIDLFVIVAILFALWQIFSPNPKPTAQPAAPTSSDSAPKVERDPNQKPTTAEAAPTPPTPPTPPSKPPVTTEFKNDAATYTFSNQGGGIKSILLHAARYAGRTEHILNHNAEASIGSLSRVAGNLDTSIWDIKEQTADSITYSKTTADGLTILKKWTVEKSETSSTKGPGYLWNLNVTLKNTSSEKYVADNFYLYTGYSKQLHNADAPFVTAVTLGDGKDNEIMTSDFDESKFLGFLWQNHPAQTTISPQFGQLTWAGVNSQYYTTLISPQKGIGGQFWARRFWNSFEDAGKPVKGWAMHAGVGLPTFSIEAGKETSFDYQIFTGPRSGTLLGKVEGNRVEAMFYGITGGISKIFLRVLNAFNGWTGSFGMAVILLTICVRIVIWPLHIKATRSMKRMGLLTPMMKEIKEKYKDKPKTPENQRKMQVETMSLYKEYQVNPVGGCLPLLLQMPIFFGYFGMLNHAVEMRGHSFLWAKDLTLPDTVFSLGWLDINPLPIIMTLTMFLQMKLQPTPPATDENQRMQMKIMKFMPFMFMLFCYANASALALYWTVQNIVSIGQTYLVQRLPEPELKKREVRKLPPVSGRNSLGQPIVDEKPKGPPPPRTGGGTKSAFKKK